MKIPEKFQTVADLLAFLIAGGLIYLGASWGIGDDGVNPQTFGVLAQIIPVLVLAYMVEARGLTESLLRTKTESEQVVERIRYAKERHAAMREAVDESKDGSTVPRNDARAKEKTDDGLLIAPAIDGVLRSLRLATVTLAATAGLGELIALVAFASKSKSIEVFTAVTAVVALLSWILVQTTLLSLKHSAILEGARADALRANRLAVEADHLAEDLKRQAADGEKA